MRPIFPSIYIEVNRLPADQILAKRDDLNGAQNSENQWWRRVDSNHRPRDYETLALTN